MQANREYILPTNGSVGEWLDRNLRREEGNCRADDQGGATSSRSAGVMRPTLRFRQVGLNGRRLTSQQTPCDAANAAISGSWRPT